MNVCLRVACAPCALSLLLIVPGATQEIPVPRYTATVVEVSGPFTSYTLTGIGAGQPVGWYSDHGFGHALVWSAGSYTPKDLHITECQDTRIQGANGKMQVGRAQGIGYMHAVLWRNSAVGAIDLNPEGVGSSEALGCGGGQQVGYGSVTSASVAILWSGSAQSAVNLNPRGYFTSKAVATDGKRQVGTGSAASGQNYANHALLWSGTAASLVDLHKPDWTGGSFATGIDGNTQVGWVGTASRSFHAVLWHGTANSAIDLHPAGFSSSQANAVHGNVQVGHAAFYMMHAMLWRGTAESAFDLHKLLPADYDRSDAIAIDELGNIVGNAFNNAKRTWDIVIWQPTRSTGQ